MKKHRIAPEVKEQIINRIKNDGVSVSEAAKDHGISDQTIYGWIAKKVDGQPTLSEFLKLKRENAQLLTLVGEMTLKLSETQKRIEEWYDNKGPPCQRARGVSRYPILPREETRQRLGAQSAY